MMHQQEIDNDAIENILAKYIKNRNYKNTEYSNGESYLPKETNQNGFEPTLHNGIQENVLPANEWFLHFASFGLSNNRNIAALCLKKEDFVNEVEGAFRKYLDYVYNMKNFCYLSLFYNELAMTFFPLFVQIFIYLFEFGYVSKAKDFFLEHYQRFTGKPSCTNILNAIHSSIEKNILDSLLSKNFKKTKFSIIITDECFKMISQFLMVEEHLSLLQIFISNFDFRLLKESKEQTFQSSSTNQKIINEKYELLEENSSGENNSSIINEVLDVIKSVQNFKQDELDKNSKDIYETNVCLLKFYSKNISSIAISNNLSKLVIGNEDSEIILWDCDLTDELQYYSSRIYRHWKRIPVKRVISDIDFKFINYENLSDENNLNDNDSISKVKDDVEPFIYRGHSDTIYDMHFIFDSNLLLSCSGDTTIRCWDTNSSACIAIYKGHAQSIWTIDANKTGNFLSGGREGTALLWDIERTIPLRICSGHKLDINQIKFHPNCNYFATASADKTIILWDVNQIRKVRMFCEHEAAITAIQFSCCGKYLISGSEDGSVRIWDISQGKSVMNIDDHFHEKIQCLEFSPNDKLMALSKDNSSCIHIWQNSLSNLKPNTEQFNKIDLKNNHQNDLDKINYSPIKLKFIRPKVLMAFTKSI